MDPAVLTGLFGLGGVVVGGGVTAWADRESANRRTLAEATAAARLVHLELSTLKTTLAQTLKQRGPWRRIPEPPFTPTVYEYAATLAPVLTPEEWSTVATLVNRCRVIEPILILGRETSIRKSEARPVGDPSRGPLDNIEPEIADVIEMIVEYIDPVLETLGPLIAGDRATRTQRIGWSLRLTPRVLGK